jgi:hypothetical protein
MDDALLKVYLAELDTVVIWKKYGGESEINGGSV